MYLPPMMCEEPKLIQPLKTLYNLYRLDLQLLETKPPYVHMETLHVTDRRRVFYNRAKSLPNIPVSMYSKQRSLNVQSTVFRSRPNQRTPI